MDYKQVYQNILANTYRNLYERDKITSNLESIIESFKNNKVFDDDNKLLIDIETFAYAAEHGNLDLLKYIEKNNNGYYDDYGIVYWSALKSGNEEILEYIIDKGYKKNVCYNKSAQFAIRGGNVEFFKRIYYAKNKWNDKTSMAENIFIKDALEYGRYEIMQYLFDNNIYNFSDNWNYLQLDHIIKLGLNRSKLNYEKVKCFYYLLNKIIELIDNRKIPNYHNINLKNLRIDDNDLPLLELDNLENIKILKNNCFILPENIKKIID